MKNFIYVLAGLITLAAPAYAGEDPRLAPRIPEESMLNLKRAESDDCVKRMRSPSISDEEAVYACDNEWLKPREGDTAEQEKIRQKLAREAAEAHEDDLRAYHQEQGD
ncbi:MAG: hypothetical protein ACXWQO_09360 [Bdellovibrionota bacterium]